MSLQLPVTRVTNKRHRVYKANNSNEELSTTLTRLGGGRDSVTGNCPCPDKPLPSTGSQCTNNRNVKQPFDKRSAGSQRTCDNRYIEDWLNTLMDQDQLAPMYCMCQNDNCVHHESKAS